MSRHLTRVVYLLFACRSFADRRVAVIGGGITGSFFTKYLLDYDEPCSLNAVHLFDPLPLGEPTPTNFVPDKNRQGSRVASVQLDDGSVVEIGASIFCEDNMMVVDMVQGDPDLTTGPPFNRGSTAPADTNPRTGLGVYGGNGLWHILTSTTPSYLKPLQLLWRYNYDLMILSSATSTMQKSFQSIRGLLESSQSASFFESPDEMWKAVGLLPPASATFDEFLDALGISRELSWWRKYLPYQGVLRDELLAAVNMCNYNQGNSAINGLVGLASFIAAKVPLRSVVNGNQQVIKSAFEQAKASQKKQCNNRVTVKSFTKTITTVVSDLKTMELFSGEESLGEYEVVVLAAPLQQAQIDFLVKSLKDDAVVQTMPFQLIPNADDEGISEQHEGHPSFPKPLPDFVTRPYTQVVTTLVKNAVVNSTYFRLKTEDLPRGIFMTESGKLIENNITAISQIKADGGVYKIFSNAPLHKSLRDVLFGPQHDVIIEKVWGGQHGGATPDYQGLGRTINYLLYDSGVGLDGEMIGAALYYPNTIETSFACMEMSAIGAKSVAKLVARRLGFLIPKEMEENDEL